MYYWGGARADGESCACGETISCVKPDKVCNCDANDNVLREDSGYITKLDHLPITAFFAGDTGEQRMSRCSSLATPVSIACHGVLRWRHR